MMLGLRIIGEFGFIIAVPVVLLALLGEWLDAKYETAPLFLVAGFVLAALLSGISIYRRAKEFGREYMSIEEASGHKKSSESKSGNNDHPDQGEAPN